MTIYNEIGDMKMEVTMVKEITVEWLEERNACHEGVEVFKKQKIREPIKLLKKYKNKYPDYCNWLIVRVMEYKQYVSYAVFAAEQVINIYEKKYPDDKRPREAIEAAKRCIDNPSEENKAAAWAAEAAWAEAACKKKMQLKILEYGINLLEGKNEKA